MRPRSNPRFPNWKANWKSHVTEAELWDNFSAWFQASKRGAFVSIGCFSTWQDFWVQTGGWKSREWHCWGAAFIKEQGRGQQLLIYDCDPVKDPTRQKELMGTQRKLLEMARKRTGVKDVWYNQDLLKSKENRCLFYKFHWISKW